MARREFDVVVVLGAGLTPSGRASPTLRRRVLRGVEVLNRTGAGALLLTGGPAGRKISEAQVMRELALEAGVTPDRIVIEPNASNTLENAERSARIMVQRGWSSPIVVSDRVHLPRALLAFRGAGFRAAGSGVRSGWRAGPFRTKLHYLIYEVAGFLWYAALLTARGRRS